VLVMASSRVTMLRTSAGEGLFDARRSMKSPFRLDRCRRI
jgi:hypothetical protein